MSTVSRRAFLVSAGVAAATAAASAAPAAAAGGSFLLNSCAVARSATDAHAASTVVAFFDGQLWLDASGLSPAYAAPSGARGAAPLAALSDDELHTLYGRI